MANPSITLIGAATAAATTITIPGVYRNGDLLIIYAFNNVSTTLPTVPAGWTSLASNAANVSAQIVAIKRAASSSETSGTWTTATGLVCHVYRGVTQSKGVTVPKAGIGGVATATGSSAILSYQSLNSILKATGGSSWIVAFAGHVTATNVALPPTNLVNRADGLSIAGFDSSGGTKAWPTTAVTVNASSGWATVTLELLSDLVGFNNYEFFQVADGMSVSEKIM